MRITDPFIVPFESFRDLKVWKKSIELTVEVYRLTRVFPPDERFGTTAQIRRAALSISHNIAEGHGRATNGEFLNALSAARGSANEVENCLLVSRELNFATDTAIQPLLVRVDEIQRMLAGFRTWLLKKRRKK